MENKIQGRVIDIRSGGHMDPNGNWVESSSDEDFPAKDIETLQKYLTYVSVGHTIVKKNDEKPYD